VPQPLPAALAVQNLLSSVHVAGDTVGVPVFVQLNFGVLVKVNSFHAEATVCAEHDVFSWAMVKVDTTVPFTPQLSVVLDSVTVYGAQSVYVGLQPQPLHPLPLPPLRTPCTVDEPPRNPVGQLPCAAIDVP